MSKVLEVREFDVITKNINFQDINKYKYIEPKAFDCLLDFIDELSYNEEQSDLLDFIQVTNKKNVGKVVTVKNYVGIISLKKDYIIEVLPKINFSNDEDTHNKNTKLIFLKMLSSLNNFSSKNFNQSNLSVYKMKVYDIFISIYINEVNTLVRRGIKSDYVIKEDNLNVFKGKLLVSDHIKNNIFHKERFYLSYDEFSINRPENKIIKSTLIKLRKITSSSKNLSDIGYLLSVFDSVQESKNYDYDFSKVKIDRNSKDYRVLMNWSKIFLYDKSFTTFSGENQAQSLLFPMEKLYESYVSKNIKKIFSPHGWTVKTQDSGKHLFVEPRKQFSLRPDIVISKDNRTIIMDTKWKSLVNNYKKNYGISQNDMYQMYAYSKKYGVSEIWLLYPYNNEFKDSENISFNSGDGTVVNLFFVDIANIEDSLIELNNRLIL